MKTGIACIHPAIPLLREAIEKQFGAVTAANVELFASKVGLNADTIRQLWGLRQKQQTTIRLSTLDILSHYLLGYTNWNQFVASTAGNADSCLSTSHKGLDVASLKPDQVICVSWQPDRMARFYYHGNQHFTISEVQNSHHLQVNDEFDCASFVVGETAYLTNLTRDDKNIGTYRIGIENGISNFSIIPS